MMKIKCTIKHRKQTLQKNFIFPLREGYFNNMKIARHLLPTTQLFCTITSKFIFRNKLIRWGDCKSLATYIFVLLIKSHHDSLNAWLGEERIFKIKKRTTKKKKPLKNKTTKQNFKRTKNWNWQTIWIDKSVFCLYFSFISASANKKNLTSAF